MTIRYFIEGYREERDRFTLVVQRGGAGVPGKGAKRFALDYALDNPDDRARLERIGMVVRGTRDRPTSCDPHRWTGTQFEVDLEASTSARIFPVRSRGYALTLAPAAARLWDLVTSGEHRALLDTHPTFFGGGCVLAARWRHRLSNDIDLFWPWGLWPGRACDACLERWACSTTTPPVLEHFSDVACKTSFDSGGVDWIESRFIDTGVQRDWIEGTNMPALGSDEILAAKLYRRAMLAVRDLYDLAVAALKEPAAADQSIQRVHDHDYVGRRHVYALRDYAPLIARTGRWHRERDKFIDPQCPEAWADGPDIVAELATRNIRRIEAMNKQTLSHEREP